MNFDESDLEARTGDRVRWYPEGRVSPQWGTVILRVGQLCEVKGDTMVCPIIHHTRLSVDYGHRHAINA